MIVGFIGLGAMGSAMARNLARAGHRVLAWNRTAREVEGVEMVDSPAEAFAANVVFTMLADDAAIQAVLLDGGVFDRAPANVVHVVTATISVAFAALLVESHRRAGIAYVSAPVLGRPDAAARAELNILAAGEEAIVERVLPLLQLLSKQVWRLGDDPVRANAAKIGCNMMITMAIEAMAEAVVIAEASGLDRARFLDLALGTLFGSRAYQNYAPNIVGQRYDAGFKASLGLKDLRLATEAAQGAGRTLPMLAAVHDRMAAAVDQGMGDRDWSVLADITLRGSD
jgi:3-hydroxyisobutyrate dehydrogenase-like beta-hydroxyacid dehydrogenase